MLLCAVAQPLNQLGTKKPVQFCSLLASPTVAVLTGGDCAGLTSHCLTSVLASGPGVGRAPGGRRDLARPPSWPGRGRGSGARAERTELRAESCAGQGDARADTFLSECAAVVWDMKSLEKLWNSKNLHSLCRVLQKREKKREMRIFCLGLLLWLPLTLRYLTFTHVGFFLPYSVISLVFSKSGVFSYLDFC